MRCAAALGFILLAACSDGTVEAPPVAADVETLRRPPQPRPRDRAGDDAEPAPASEAVAPAASAAAPVDPAAAALSFYVDDATPAPPPANALTPQNLGDRLRASVRAGAGESPAALVHSIERDPALVKAAAELLATTQDEDVCRAIHTGLYGRFLGNQWWAERPALIRAAEAPGPASRRAAAFLAMGENEGFRSVAGGGTDPDVRAAIFRRARFETDQSVVLAIGNCLGYGKLSDDERAVLFECAKRVEVPMDAAVGSVPRSARRVLYEILASDGLFRDDWSAYLARLDAAPTQAERDDLCAGFGILGDYVKGPDAGEAGSAERAKRLAARREAMSRFYRTANDYAFRRRLLNTSRGGLNVLPSDANAPEDERRAAAALLGELIAFETDAETLALLKAALAQLGL